MLYKGNFKMVAVNDPIGNHFIINIYIFSANKGLRSAELIMEYSLYLSLLPIASSALGVTSYMFALEGDIRYSNMNPFILSIIVYEMRVYTCV